MIEKRNISAVILAAGFSSRMGDFKPLMELGGTNALEMVISLFKRNNIDEVIVVSGHNKDITENKIKEYGARAVFNENFESGMLSSVQAGVSKVSGSEGFFILPVDIPAIRDSSIKTIMNSFDGSNIVMPYFDGKSGHPPLVSLKYRDEILALDNNNSMHDFFNSFKENTVSVNIFDRGILMDMDNRDQHQEIKRKLAKKEIPDFYECLVIINHYLNDKKKLISHLKAVSKVSLTIVESLKTELDRDLIAASSLLHDISKGEKDHGKRGAFLMESLGFKKVAGIISDHMDIKIDPDKDIQEKEIIYFADKICSQDKIELNYEEKFNRKIEAFPWAKSEILKRYENTRFIQARIEKDAGKSLKEIFNKG